MTRRMTPPAMPPTMGPHFSARDFCSGGLSESEDEAEGDEEGAEVDGRGFVAVVGVGVVMGVCVGLGGKERDRVVVPVGANVAYNDAELEASAE